MKELNDDLKDWRKSQVLDYMGKNLTQAEMSKLLQVSEATISRDVSQIREQAKAQIRTAILATCTMVNNTSSTKISC
jgi:hypothetical protein